MAGVLDKVRVLDLSWGIAGPMTAMLLGDNGADVIKIEPPGGDPYRNQLGYKVWQRGKRSAIYDLKSPTDNRAFQDLVKTADILVESYSPGVTGRLGIDYATLSKINPRLIYCSITGYGRDNEHSKRPAYDGLVQARTGLMWEQRGWAEGALNHMNGLPDPYPEDVVQIPPDWVQGAPRPGPLFVASHWPSLGAFFTASLGISAALRAREHTGKGQWVETSLLQGAMAGAAGVWQRAEKPDAPGFDTWILNCRSPKGHFKCKDGKWIHNWVPNPRFILQASKGDKLDASPDLTVQNDPDRFGTGPEEILVMAHYQPILAEAIAKFTAKEWTDAAAQAEMTMQPVRPIEESLADPEFLKDGCVVEQTDPELGTIRTVGNAFNMSLTQGKPGAPPVKAGANTAEVKSEAAKILKEAKAGTVAANSGKKLEVAARRRRRPRPWSGHRRTVRHAAAVRSRRHGHQDQRALRHLLAPRAHRLHGQPRQEEHHAEPQRPALDEDPARSRRQGRRGPAQHALRRRRAPEDRLRVAEEAEPQADLLPHPRLRAWRAPGYARQRPDRRVPVGHPVRGRRHGPRRQAAVELHVVRRHRQRLPLRHRHHQRALPSRSHRRGSVRRHLDHQRGAAQHQLRGGQARRHRLRAPAHRRHAARLLRRPSHLRDQGRLAVLRAGDAGALGRALHRAARAQADNGPASLRRTRRACRTTRRSPTSSPSA